MNPLRQVNEYGQALWLDFIRRDLLENEGLRRMIENDGISGVTSNPSIFEKAITGSDDYGDAIKALTPVCGNEESLYEKLAVADVRAAADLLYPVYSRTDGADGFVSLEVSPRLAEDAEATIHAANRLWTVVDRPNLMIKVPATAAGLVAFEKLIADGVNVNITLLFSLDVYEQVLESYLRGLERRRIAGLEVKDCASVASFFLSRIDTEVDKLIDERLSTGPEAAHVTLLQEGKGKIAIDCARMAYQHWKQVLSSPRWQALQAAGARPQRLLWASTGTKNPAYSDVLYVESLIGPNTVNTVPPATLEAFRDHGHARLSLEDDLSSAARRLESLGALGVNLSGVTDKLLAQGLQQFQEAYSRLLDAIRRERQAA